METRYMDAKTTIGRFFHEQRANMAKGVVKYSIHSTFIVHNDPLTHVMVLEANTPGRSGSMKFMKLRLAAMYFQNCKDVK